MKKVDKYEFSLNSSVWDGGIQTYVGFNTETQQQHTIKKINLKQNQNNAFETLFDQIKIMKKVIHPNILCCHKILQTSRHMYLVYDLHHQKRLGDIIQTRLHTISIAQKINYVKQIIIGLKQLQNYGIIHLQLNPNNIYITNQNSVKIGGFKYSATLSKEKNRISLTHIPPLSIFVPNQIKEYRIAFQNSDVYSLGKIIRTLNIDEFIDNKNLNVGELIENMIHNNPSVRISLNEVQSVIVKNKPLHSSPLIKSQRSNFSNSKSTRISPFSPREPFSPKILFSPTCAQKRKKGVFNKQRSIQFQTEKKIITKNLTQKQLSTIEQIPKPTQINEANQKHQNHFKLHLQYLQTLKWRNLSIFLTQIASSCCRVTMSNLVHLQLAFLLIKKGVSIISMLHENVQKIQKNTLLQSFDEQKISHLQQIKKLKQIFKKEKDSHFNKYKSLQQIIQQSRISNFSFNSGKIDELIKKKIGQFLENQNQLEALEKPHLVNLYFLCQILQYESCESMFEILANKSILTLNEQSFMMRIEKYSEKDLIKIIKSKLCKKL